MNVRAERWLGLLSLLTGLFLAGAGPVEAKGKKPSSDGTTAPQDPMEVENSSIANPPPPPQTKPSSQHSSSGSSGTSGTSSPNGNGTPSSGNNSSSSAESNPPPPPPTEKVGRFMANIKVGPAICLYACSHEGLILLELGVSVLPNKNGYLVLPLQFQFAPSGSVVMVPIGFQYDLAVPRVPGLYFYPRFSVGYALIIDNVNSSTPMTHGGVILPEFGVKYVYHGRFNIGGEFFSLPMVLGPTAVGYLNLYYRISLSAGVNF